MSHKSYFNTPTSTSPNYQDEITALAETKNTVGTQTFSGHLCHTFVQRETATLVMFIPLFIGLSPLFPGDPQV